MPVFTADAIYTPTGWIKDQVLATDQEGTIQSIRTIDPADKVIRFKGVLVPGFINAHCHLELSHLHGHIPAGLGMVPFIQEVIKARGSHEQEEQQAAVLSALSYSHEKGIVGIGDISNSGLSAKAKRNHPVRTQTFIELLGLIPEKAEEIIEGGHKLKEAFQGLAASLTLHAPYSVSKKLIQNVYQASSERMSVHLLESAAEVALFESGTGPFVDFYQKMGLSLPSSEGKDPITYLAGVKPSERDVLWVHLTEASTQQLLQIRTQFQNSWFCLCPRSNLYLHNKLPYLPHFLAYANRICLGT
ncbi:MAG: amidohydrolase family protein, partial [Bacteroidota bacterium]